jgi:antitoxin PrlF
MQMPGVLEIEATVTERGQTTVPAAVRKALRVGKQGKILFRIEGENRVTVIRKEDEETADPVVEAFLGLLERDMIARPERLHPVTRGWLEEARSLVAGVEYDIDEPLAPEGDDE